MKSLLKTMVHRRSWARLLTAREQAGKQRQRHLVEERRMPGHIWILRMPGGREGERETDRIT